MKKSSPEASSVEDGGMQIRHLRPTFLTSMIADGHWKDDSSGVGHGKAGGHQCPRHGVSKVDLPVKWTKKAGEQ